MMPTIIGIVAIVGIIAMATRYIIKEKKKGTRCIGCPSAGTDECKCHHR